MTEKVFSTRVDDELQREFRSIIVGKGMTVGAVVRQLMQDYIIREGGSVPQVGAETQEWVDPIETGTWNAETMEALREVEEGRGERFESKEALFRDLGIL